MKTSRIERRSAREWSEHARRTLAEHGYRAGGARSAVIETLAAERGCVDAERLGERLRTGPRRVATASVYRALGLLSEIGLLHKVALPDAPARFELVLPDGSHHHHIVCERCGRTVPFSDEDLERAVESIGESSSYEVRSHEITLHGRCPDCRA